jgi:hypothetical protein
MCRNCGGNEEMQKGKKKSLANQGGCVRNEVKAQVV